MRRLLRWLLAVGLLAWANPGFGEPPAKGTSRALLVGCTAYPNLKEHFQLKGPANDVLLMRELLEKKFRIPKDNVVILSESAGEKNRPTRAHIAREFDRLAEAVKPDDFVFIFLAGHGSQQPATQADDPEDFEPDGLDEIFLPADVSGWDNKQSKVANAITDNEFRAWLKAIRGKGAFVWMVVDSCHAATMIRGNGEETTRHVPVEELVPAKALEEAQRRAKPAAGENTRGAGSSPLQQAGRDAGLVAIYASQSTEPTVEMKLPHDSADQKPFGLLTYTMCRILTQAQSPLTYAELTQRIHAQYAGRGRLSPTPLVEGADRHRAVGPGGDWQKRPPIFLSRDDDGALKINAGALLGLTPGSILAVYPPPEQPNADKVMGHVKITAEIWPHAAGVEPCAFAETPVQPNLKEGRCESVYVDFGDQRLKAAVDPADSGGNPIDANARQRLEKTLSEAAKAPGSLVKAETEISKADWLVRLEKDKLYLVPATGWVAEKERRELPPLFGPGPADENAKAWLEDRLGRIARVRNLVQLASTSAEEEGGLKLHVEMVRLRDKADKIGEIIPWQSDGLVLHGGERIGFRVRNRSKFAVDVTLLFLDSGYGIEPFFPDPRRGDPNRLGPNEATPLLRGQVNEQTHGLEHLLVVGIKAQGQPMDFSALAQPTLERAQNLERTRGSNVFERSLGKVLQNALYAQGNTRGWNRNDEDEYVLKLISWKTLPGGGKKE